ncbi:MAG TPA: histidine kinase N-terminal 7TM domain-containing protein [Candidatus Saccharimonadales bacterium]|nr:histidine kinase N-terminal 7TM domain-containing protein [Candidatus Saccharimonadales bacterium]
MRKQERNTLYCFSPPVMIATCIIEVSLMLYTFVRYKFNPLTRLVGAMLVCLAIFQLAEFMVCRNVGGNGLVWSRVGFMAITLLPPLGIHVLYTIAGAKKRPLLWLGYASAAAFLAFFAVAGHSITGHSCLGNYVIFELAPGSGWLYGLYYYAFLVAALLLGWYYLRHAGKRPKRAISGVMLGYAIFLLPSTTAHMLSPETLNAIPSVMCGFAVLLAFAMCFITLPAALKTKTRRAR